MGNRIAAALALCLLAVQPAAAQILPIPPGPRADPMFNFPYNATLLDPVFLTPPEQDPNLFPFWARTNYLLGWVRQDPLPIPLLTQGDSKDKHPGAVGQPGTSVLFGNAGLGYRRFSGMGFAAGAWVDADRRFGIEAAGYVMENRVAVLAKQSDANGAPLLALPFFNVTPGAEGESAIVLSQSKKRIADVAIATALQRWGMEVSGLYCIWRTPGLECSALVGLRYDDMFEHLDLAANSAALGKGASFSLADHFATRNQFSGAQLGGRVHWQYEALYFAATAKVALGSTRQVLNIAGDSSSAAATYPGGLFAQPSNIGRYTDTTFGVIPTLEVKMGLQIMPRLRAFIGYDIMAWRVLRPGEQLDRNINLTQSGLFGTTQGALTGPASPSPTFQRSTFWAQAASFGVELRY